MGPQHTVRKTPRRRAAPPVKNSDIAQAAVMGRLRTLGSAAQHSATGPGVRGVLGDEPWVGRRSRAFRAAGAFEVRRVVGEGSSEMTGPGHGRRSPAAGRAWGRRGRDCPEAWGGAAVGWPGSEPEASRQGSPAGCQAPGARAGPGSVTPLRSGISAMPPRISPGRERAARRRLLRAGKPLSWSGSPGRARTADLVINSHPLYQLSYRGRQPRIVPSGG